MESADFELVALVAAVGDRGAFSELVSRHQAAVRGLLRRMTGNRAMADDLSQVTFIRAFRKISTFTGKGSFKGWLCRIAYNEFLQARRKHAATEVVMERYREHLERQPRAHRWDSGDELDLDRALAQLREEERAVIVMCYSCGFSHGDAAEVIGMPLGTVKSHIARGKVKLRALLEVPEEVVA